MGFGWDGMGWSGAITFKLLFARSNAGTILCLRHGFGVWVGWRGAIRFKLPCTRTWCYAGAIKTGCNFCIVTDGAPFYPKLTAENNVGHEACNHSKGFFRIKKKKRPGHPEVAISGPVELMECGRFPTVPSQVLGTPTGEWRWQSSLQGI